MATSQLILENALNDLRRLPQELVLKRLQELSSEDQSILLDGLCSMNTAAWDAGPLFWATTFTKTENPHYAKQGREFKAPFPRKSYFVPVLNEIFKSPRLFLPKTREMMTSWEVMVYATHQAQWHKSEVVVQTDKQEKAGELIGYAECLYRNQDDWLKKLHPLSGQSVLSLQFASGGRIFGIPSGVHQIRMFHPTIYVMDEVAFLPEAQQCYDTAQPVAKQIIGISSAGPGWFGDECSR